MTSRLAVLVYHRVAEDPVDPFGLCVPPAAFRSQMQTLVRSYRPVPLATRLDEIRSGPGAVAVSFDDGYLDNLEIASPILEELDVPATFFLTTGSLSSPVPFWWDRLASIVMSARAIPDRLSLRFGRGHEDLPTDRVDCLRTAHAKLRSMPPKTCEQVLDRLATDLAIGEEPTLPVSLSAAGVGALAHRRGHSIGAHGVAHRYLPELPTHEQVLELTASREALESITGQPVDAVAYPFGAADRRTARAAAMAGFSRGYGVGGGLVNQASNAFHLPRIEVHAGDDLNALLGGYFSDVQPV